MILSGMRPAEWFIDIPVYLNLESKRLGCDPFDVVAPMATFESLPRLSGGLQKEPCGLEQGFCTSPRQAPRWQTVIHIPTLKLFCWGDKDTCMPLSECSFFSGTTYGLLPPRLPGVKRSSQSTVYKIKDGEKLVAVWNPMIVQSLLLQSFRDCL